jgi:hypothetical protein
MNLARILCICLCLVAVQAAGDPTYHEAEPNDEPADFHGIDGVVSLSGTMLGQDQDGFLWTVSDNDARKRWNFELQGIPGALTITDVVVLEYAANGVDITGKHSIMKMGSRDGSMPATENGLIFEPGEYVLGFAQLGAGSARNANAAYRPPMSSLSFVAEEVTTGAETAAEAPAPDASDGAYRFLITEQSFNVMKNPGPRETRDKAYNLRLGSSFATFEPRSIAWYRFDFSEQNAQSRWDIHVQVPVGRSATAKLYDAEGKLLSEGRTDKPGRLRLPDLAPPAGTWYLEVTTTDPGFVQRVASEAVGQRVAGEEAEPNNSWTTANRVDFAQPLSGKIGGADRTDYFFFDVDEANADQLLTLRSQTEPEAQHQLCLTSASRVTLQCKNGIGQVELPDLLLTPGTWGMYVERATETSYTVALEQQGPVDPGREVEPNDYIGNASAVPGNLRIRGRFSGKGHEVDHYRFLVPGEPQLWRFQVIGDGVSEIRYYDGGGILKSTIRPQGERRIRFENLFLLPGRHTLSVAGANGDYTVLARPLGPPDPDGEIESNDEHNKQRIMIGQTRRGLLSEKNDTDHFRFFVGNDDHLKLTIQPPPDGIIHGYAYWYTGQIGQIIPGAPGETIVMEGLFPPGDYYLNLLARQVSDAEYTVSLERLPRFTVPADSEPNGQGNIWLASPLPNDLILEGNSGAWRDWDYYQLPAFDHPTELLLKTPEKVATLTVGTRIRELEHLSYDAELGAYRTSIPAGPPHRIMLNSNKKPYRILLEFPGGELVPVTEALPADLKLELDHKAVSAYRTNGQRIAGTLKISNSGMAPLNASLEAVTSDFRWQVEAGQSDIAVPPGGSLDVPVEVRAPADAWADIAVRISVRIYDEAGRQAETWQEIDVEREIPPASPYLYWAIPEALRGGFNAAWLPFGGEWTDDTPKSIRTDTMRDNLVFPHLAVECCSDGDGWSDAERPLLSVDLPGDEALPVRGVGINHFGANWTFYDIRNATLLLSLDGITFDEVLTFETKQIRNEQHFFLDEPVLAKFARLRVNETFQEPSSNRLNAAEWKVILEPGHDLSGGKGFNIADKDFGGHLAWDWPPKPYKPNSVVVEDDQKTGAHMLRGMTKDYVIGFNENRAAQITRVEWKHADSTPLEYRNFATVAVAASTESSVGPWQPLGEFDLSDGRVEGSLELAAPTWARFVRFTATRKEDGRTPYIPDVIRVWERPTDDEYRSVLTEWGDLTSRAYYELQTGLQPEATLTPVNNDSRERAAALAVEQITAGQVSLGKQEHWYRVTMPAGDNTLKLQLEGNPTVRTRLVLEDSAGNEIPFKRVGNGETPAKHLMEAVVDAGSEVWVNVAEPPRNVVFTWDTSASVNAYLPTINNALVAFSSQVVPGREAVNLMPFSSSLLLDEWYGEPYMLQTTLNDYRRTGSSSSAHSTLKTATRAMQDLPGTKAVVMISDADSPNDGAVWGPLQNVQPRVFGIGVAGDARYQQDTLRDWAHVNGGHYTQLRYDGEMEVAFDRATTLMHRPAGYRLVASSEYREAPGPGQLSIIAGDGSGGGSGAAVELILDASGSMLKRIEGKRRIVVAKEVLTEAVREHIPAGTPVALRVFGHREVDSCRTDLEIPLAPLDPDAAAAKIAGINAMNLARTPIAASLAAVAGDLQGASAGVVVLVTDGEETCEGDPGAAIIALRDRGFNVTLNIVGFAIDDAELAAQFGAWAELGGGRYLGASDAADLSKAIEQALKTSYTVYDAGGNEIATGEVGGDAVELERGNYRIVVNSVPRKTFDNVTIEGEDDVALNLQ